MPDRDKGERFKEIMTDGDKKNVKVSWPIWNICAMCPYCEARQSR